VPDYSSSVDDRLEPNDAALWHMGGTKQKPSSLPFYGEIFHFRVETIFLSLYSGEGNVYHFRGKKIECKTSWAQASNEK